MLPHLCPPTCPHVHSLTVYGALHPPRFLPPISFTSCIVNNCHIHPPVDVPLAPHTHDVQTLSSLSSPQSLPAQVRCPHYSPSDLSNRQLWRGYGLSSQTSNAIPFSRNKFPQHGLFLFPQKAFSQNKFQASSIPMGQILNFSRQHSRPPSS